MSDEPTPSGMLVPGQRIRILAGTFEGFEATVESVDAASGNVHAGINIFGCVTPVDVHVDDCEMIP